MKSKRSNILIRLAELPSIEECLDEIGVAIDLEAGIGITSFCWVNGLDMAEVVFEPTIIGEEFL